jgi:hypothetical protein
MDEYLKSLGYASKAAAIELFNDALWDQFTARRPEPIEGEHRIYAREIESAMTASFTLRPAADAPDRAVQMVDVITRSAAEQYPNTVLILQPASVDIAGVGPQGTIYVVKVSIYLYRVLAEEEAPEIGDVQFELAADSAEEEVA